MYTDRFSKDEWSKLFSKHNISTACVTCVEMFSALKAECESLGLPLDIPKAKTSHTILDRIVILQGRILDFYDSRKKSDTEAETGINGVPATLTNYVTRNNKARRSERIKQLRDRLRSF